MRAILPLLIFVGIVGGLNVVGASNKLPAFKAERWVSSAPLTAELLRGKVVLLDVWEYTCINWIRTLPYIQAWNREYASLGLVVVGVHSPEFEFGKRAENIDRGIRDHGLTFRSRSTTSSRSGGLWATTPGQRSTFSTGRDAWSSGGSARGATTRSNQRSGGCWPRPSLGLGCQL